MAFDQREEFGLGHAGEPERRELRTRAIIGAIAGLAFVSTWWWLPLPTSDALLGRIAEQLFAWVAPLIGLGMIAYSMSATRRLLRIRDEPATSGPYRLGDARSAALSIWRQMEPVVGRSLRSLQ